MATWPSAPTLPALTEFTQDSYNESFADNVVRTDMDIGPPKARRRGTAAPEYIAGSIKMTATQIANLKTFFETTVSYGADEFDITHPRSGASESAMFTGPPQIAPAGGVYWLASISLMVMP